MAEVPLGAPLYLEAFPNARVVYEKCGFKPVYDNTGTVRDMVMIRRPERKIQS